MTSHQSLRELALQRRKSKAVGLIPFEKKLNKAITESTNAVVENNWLGISGGQNVRSDALNATLFELKRIDVIVEGLVPVADSFFRSSEFHEIRTSWRLDDRAPQTVNRIAVLWSAIL